MKGTNEKKNKTEPKATAELCECLCKLNLNLFWQRIEKKNQTEHVKMNGKKNETKREKSIEL